MRGGDESRTGYYERNLPHWQPEGRAIFLTWRLYGSLPAAVLRRLARMANTPGKQFAAAEGVLDGARSGPLWLRDPAVAGCVLDVLRKGASELRAFELFGFVIMPNHVHILIDPAVPLHRITKGIKGTAARQANRILQRTGQPFWQDESFDHWVRGAVEFERVRAYIEQNPVNARLVQRAEDWPWSSARK